MGYNKDQKSNPMNNFGSNNSSNNNRGNTPGNGGGFKFNLYWLYSAIALALFGIYLFSSGETSREVGYSDFARMAQEGDFSKMVVYTNKDAVEATLTQAPEGENLKGLKTLYEKAKSEGKSVTIETSIPSADKFADEVERWKNDPDSKFNADVRYEKSSNFWDMFWSFGSPLLILMLFWFFIFRRMSGPGSMGGGGIFSVGKSKAQVYEKDNRVQVTFKDVAGLSEAKQEVQEIVEFLKNPQKFTNLGGKIPKGALLVGPPGTGKTLLAKAVAGEADVPFFSMSGSDFVEMFVGVGASRVRDLFHQAKEKAPCIIFIDEIDAVGRARGKNPNMGSNDERENTLNQLLTEMDGFGTNSGVIILAATNRADILDKALLRAGRFDRQIHVDLPELNDRIEIFNVHLRPLHLDPNVDVKLLARQTPGFSGADIANVCNEAALIAARRGKTQVEKQDFNDAVDRIIGGLEKKSKVMTRDEKHAIAVHEAGHATLSWHLQYASPLVKVTIVPRGKALGAAWYMPEERQITTKEQMLDELCATLGGRAAEELFLGRISSGAANDLERVTKQAYAMVVYYGMSQQLPNVCYYDSTGQDYGFTKPYSEERAKVIDQEISALIQEQYERAKVMLKQYAEGHAQLTQVLMEREVIFTEDVEHIFGARPWASRSEEIMQDQQSGASPDEETPAAQSTPQEPSTTDTASH
jgi:cell division protease FtsH